MKILITGATGLVGTKLVELCVNRNIDVHYLTTSKEKLHSNEPSEGFYWNPQKGEIDTSCFEGVDAIINLAGAPIAKRWTASYKDQILNSRLQSLQTLYRGIEQAGTESIHSLISASAIGIYPHSMTTFYGEKEDSTANGFAGKVVEAWERETLEFKKIIPTVAIIRIGLVLSDKGGALEKMAKAVRMGVGSAFGSGEQWQSWIHIKDLAEMLLFVCENEVEGTYNAVAPNPVTQNKLIKELAKVLQKPLFMPNIPKFALYFMMGEMSEIVLSSQRVSSKKIESRGFEFDYQNICRALEGIYLPAST